MPPSFLSRCDEFFYGNPLEIGGSCLPCDCNGGLCDNKTGKCLECTGNTEGILCEKCKPYHYRTSNSSFCSRKFLFFPPLRPPLPPYLSEKAFINVLFFLSACDCYANGSESEFCDEISGQCPCKNNYHGRNCSECVVGYTYAEDGSCENCNCGLGSESNECDPTTGECDCKSGTRSPKCDECESQHYGLSPEGCKGKSNLLLYT